VNWLAVRVHADGAERAAALGALFAAGSRAVEVIGDDLRTYFPLGTDPKPVVRAITAASPSARVETEEVGVTDWDTAWRAQLTAHRAGRITVAPPWLADAFDAASTVIVDPGMAFGTGDHATTRGVLRLMSHLVREGDRVADLGAGSAVLAIAAAKLGAAWVAAIEVDPDAIENAEANVRANAVADRVTVLLGDAALLLSLVAPVRLVVANIVARVLVSLLPVIGRALTPDGCAVVGGITTDERAEFLRSLDEAGWIVRSEDLEDNWWSAVVAPR
jgi:ribosomal protein L11 methyltransferase